MITVSGELTAVEGAEPGTVVFVNRSYFTAWMQGKCTLEEFSKHCCVIKGLVLPPEEAAAAWGGKAS